MPRLWIRLAPGMPVLLAVHWSFDFPTVNAVEFQGVSKSYAIYDAPGDRLKELLSLNRLKRQTAPRRKVPPCRHKDFQICSCPQPWIPSARRRASAPEIGCTKLYLNAVISQLGSQLLRVSMVNHVKSQTPRAFEIERTVVDEHALLRRTLRHFQSDAEDSLFRLARTHVARTEENLKIAAQVKCFNAVLVELERLKTDGLFERGRGEEELDGALGLVEEDQEALEDGLVCRP